MKSKLITIALVILAFYLGSHRDIPTPQVPERQWTTSDSKAYARDSLLAWTDANYVCLDKLWSAESNWRPNAYNRTRVMGKHAGGIPQLLGMSPKTPVTQQIDRGIAYIKFRYGTPCAAWKHHLRKGWY